MSSDESDCLESVIASSIDLSNRDWKSATACSQAMLKGRFHAGRPRDKLGWPAVVKRAEADDVHFSHNGAQSSRKTRGEQEDYPCGPGVNRMAPNVKTHSV